jgi:protein TonB
MKAVPSFAVLSALLASGMLAQTPAPPAAVIPPTHHIQISANAAERLLLHKVKICYPQVAAARVTGTVIVAIKIDRNGNVLDPTVVSGPAMLQQMVLDAVRQYKYKPYILNGKATIVETTVSVKMGLSGDCPAS